MTFPSLHRCRARVLALAAGWPAARRSTACSAATRSTTEQRRQDRAARSAARPDASCRATRAIQPQAGSVSAIDLPGQAASAVRDGHAATVAPTSIGDVRIERAGTQRWLVVPLPPDQLWPQLQAFWQERGFLLAIDQPADRRDGNRLGREPRQDAAGHHPQHARQAARLAVLHRRARQLPHPRRAHAARRQRDLHQPPRHGRGLHQHAAGPDHVAAARRPTRSSRPSSCRA